MKHFQRTYLLEYFLACRNGMSKKFENNWIKTKFDYERQTLTKGCKQNLIFNPHNLKLRKYSTFDSTQKNSISRPDFKIFPTTSFSWEANKQIKLSNNLLQIESQHNEHNNENNNVCQSSNIIQARKLKIISLPSIFISISIQCNKIAKTKTKHKMPYTLQPYTCTSESTHVSPKNENKIKREWIATV